MNVNVPNISSNSSSFKVPLPPLSSPKQLPGQNKANAIVIEEISKRKEGDCTDKGKRKITSLSKKDVSSTQGVLSKRTKRDSAVPDLIKDLKQLRKDLEQSISEREKKKESLLSKIPALKEEIAELEALKKTLEENQPQRIEVQRLPTFSSVSATDDLPDDEKELKQLAKQLRKEVKKSEKAIERLRLQKMQLEKEIFPLQEKLEFLKKHGQEKLYELPVDEKENISHQSVSKQADEQRRAFTIDSLINY